MALLDQLQKDIVTAMKARDEGRLSAIRMVKSALMKEQVDSMKTLDEAAEMKVLNSLIKQRKDAAEMFHKGGRAELAGKEEAEPEDHRILHARVRHGGGDCGGDRRGAGRNGRDGRETDGSRHEGRAG